MSKIAFWFKGSWPPDHEQSPKGKMSTASTITQNGALFFAHQKTSKRIELIRAFRTASKDRKRNKSAIAPRLINGEELLFSGIHFPQLGPLEQF